MFANLFADLFGDDAPVIHAYTRAQAIADGVLVDISETAKEAGFRYPVACTSAVWSDCIEWTGKDKMEAELDEARKAAREASAQLGRVSGELDALRSQVASQEATIRGFTAQAKKADKS